jgi:hypothetical protein
MRRVLCYLIAISIILISTNILANQEMGIKSTDNTTYQAGVAGSLVGTWLTFVKGQGYFQIIFYADGTYRTNIFGRIENGTYQITETVVIFSSSATTFKLPYRLQGYSLQLTMNMVNFQFDRASASALKSLGGRFCGSGKGDIDSPYETVIRFDGLGGYTLGGFPGLYWVDYLGVHMIMPLEGFWSDWNYPTVSKDKNGRIILFSGHLGNYYRCD